MDAESEKDLDKISAKEDDTNWEEPCPASKIPNTDSIFKDYNDIIARLKSAYKHMYNKKGDSYVLSTYGSDYTAFQAMYPRLYYSWLPSPLQIPHTSNDMDESIKEKTLVTALTIHFIHLQRYAIALEQIGMDQKKYKKKYLQEFQEREKELSEILCEFTGAMTRAKLTIPTTMSRDIFPEALKDLKEEEDRKVRDFIILRDYANGLFYMIKVFEDLNSKPVEEEPEVKEEDNKSLASKLSRSRSRIMNKLSRSKLRRKNS